MDKYQISGLVYSNNGDRVEYADSKQDKNRYVLKFINKNNKKSQNNISYERQILTQLNHQNIIYMKQAFQTHQNDKTFQVIVLEYCSGGDLGKLIQFNQDNKYDLVRRLELFINVLQGLKHMHSKNILHRDIKPENIMISRGIAKIGDLGTAINLNNNGGNLGKKIGTKFYMSPQVNTNQKYGLESDLWSLGLLLLELCMNQRLTSVLPGLDAPCQKLNFPSPDILQLVKHQKLRKIVMKMLIKKPSSRLNLDDLQKKIRAIHRQLIKSCNYVIKKIQLPLVLDEEESGSLKSNEQSRIDPRKRLIAIQKYKMGTSSNKTIIVYYDDHLQELTLKYEKIHKIVYTYKILPKEIKQICNNLSQLNTILKQKNKKIVYESNGALSFDHQIRMPYQQIIKQNTSVNMSMNMSVNISKDQSHNMSQLSEIHPPEAFSKIQSQQQSQILLNDGHNDSEMSHNSHKEVSNSQININPQSKGNILDQVNNQSSNNILTAQLVEGNETKKSTFVDLKLEEIISNKENDNKDEDSNQDSNQIGFSSKQPSQKSSNPSKKPKKAKKTNPDLQPSMIPQIPQLNNQLTKTMPRESMFENPFGGSNPLNGGFSKVEPAVQNQLVVSQGYPTFNTQRPDFPSQKNQQNFNPQQNYANQNSHKINQQAQSLQAQIAILQKISGPEKRLLADHYVRLGKLYKDALNHESAKANLKNGVEKYQQFKMYYSDDCANAISLVGQLFAQEGKFQESLTQYQLSLEIKNQIGSNDYITLSHIYNSIGEAHMRLQNWHFAANSFEEAIGKVKDYFGQEKRMKISPAINLGIVRIKIGQYSDAMMILQQALQIHSKHPTKKIFEILKNLTTVHYRLKNFEEGHDKLQSLINHVKHQKNKAQQNQLLICIEEWLNILFEYDVSQTEEYLARLKEYLQITLPQFQQLSQMIQSHLNK